jgi:hypothetical protein
MSSALLRTWQLCTSTAVVVAQGRQGQRRKPTLLAASEAISACLAPMNKSLAEMSKSQG